MQASSSLGRVQGAILALAVLFAACGKKGDPLPPLLPIPQAATDLTLEQRGDQLILRFSYPRTTTGGQPLPGLDRVEVFELARPATLPPEPEEGEAEDEAASAEEPAAEEPAAEAEEAPPAWQPPAVNARDFSAAATLRTTVRGDALDAAVQGDRIVLSLPVPGTAGVTASPDEPPAAHFFAVRTVAVGDFASAHSNRPAIIPASPPSPPRELALTPGADGIAVAWQASGSEGLEGYNIYRRAATSRDFTDAPQPVRGERTEQNDRTARFGDRYIYAVTAVVSRRPLIESAIVETREIHYVDTFAPPAPTGLVALADEGGIRLLWNESEAGDLAGYRLERRTAEGPWQALSGELLGELDFQDATAQPGVEYRYRVIAVDTNGNESGVADEAATSIPAPAAEPRPAAGDGR